MIPIELKTSFQMVLSEMMIETYEPCKFYSSTSGREGWQGAVEILYRLLKCKLVEFWPSSPLKALECENVEEYAVFLSKNNPYYLTHKKEISEQKDSEIFKFWFGPLLVITDVMKDMLTRHQVVELEEQDQLSDSFFNELEEVFIKNNVPWSDKPLFSVVDE